MDISSFSRAEKFQLVRQMGKIQRGHILGFDRLYSLESHQYQCVMLFYYMVDIDFFTKEFEDNMNVLSIVDELLTHDHGELITGDIPHHTKNEISSVLLDEYEEKSRNELLAQVHKGKRKLIKELTEDEKCVVSLIDSIEFFISSKEDTSNHPALRRARVLSRGSITEKTERYIDKGILSGKTDVFDLIEDCMGIM